ncbi:hypothetical protein KFL_000330190 [Klebsormidium nitens]|uniref:Uncharacterized protein n=1 Tax=Klebsormidium nitens TaxID=105231 RepID=A0A1Y1HNG5_KLENI|nr:hypothetical protein KFL_000330190 [Klebsormidium nitens]|eukprot:GAQ79573.1 hypothetical protein KFL_000330190 [Klebsormidium nitens]
MTSLPGAGKACSFSPSPGNVPDWPHRPTCRDAAPRLLRVQLVGEQTPKTLLFDLGKPRCSVACNEMPFYIHRTREAGDSRGAS